MVKDDNNETAITFYTNLAEFIQNTKPAYISAVLAELEADLAIHEERSDETAAQIKVRKLTFLDTKATYLQVHLIPLLQEGSQITVHNYSEIGDFILSVKQITSGVAYWEAEQTKLPLQLQDAQQKLTWAENDNNQPAITFYTHLVDFLENAKPAYISAVLAELEADLAIHEKKQRETAAQIRSRKLTFFDIKITYLQENLIPLLQEGSQVTVRSYTGLSLIPVQAPGEDNPKTQNINEAYIGTGTDDANTPVDESLIFTVEQVREYWNTDDHNPDTMTKMGRLDRIQTEAIPYWRSVSQNPLLTKGQRNFIESLIHNLQREHEYGLKYALAEAEKDEKFQTGNPDNETINHVIRRKKEARDTELSIFRERVNILPEMNTFSEELFGKDLKKLKDYQEWVDKQRETSLRNVTMYSGFGRNPYEKFLESLVTMNAANKQRLDAKRPFNKEQKQAQEQINAVYKNYVEKLRKYSEALKASQEEITTNLQASEFTNKDEVIRQLNTFFRTLERSPPAIVKKGSALLFTEEDKSTPLIFLEGQEIKQYIETTFTRLKNEGEIEWPTSSHFSAYDLARIFKNRIGFDVYAGRTQAMIEGAPWQEYLALGIRLEPQQANLINNIILGYEQRGRFFGDYGSTSKNPNGTTEEKDYLLLVNSFGISSDGGELYLCVQ